MPPEHFFFTKFLDDSSGHVKYNSNTLLNLKVDPIKGIFVIEEECLEIYFSLISMWVSGRSGRQ